jgi:hypothetical protein
MEGLESYLPHSSYIPSGILSLHFCEMCEYLKRLALPQVLQVELRDKNLLHN